MKKITFIGDIMCERPLQKASQRKGGYSFEQVFEGCRELFKDSDYVVGNFETVLGGKEAVYTNSLFSFNSPDEFAEALSGSGINMVTLANNHILDRDKEGLLRTIKTLDRLGVEHIGAYSSEIDRNKVFQKSFNGVKVAFLNYTQGTNIDDSPYRLNDSEYYMLNLLMPQAYLTPSSNTGIRRTIVKAVKRLIPDREYLQIRKTLHLPYLNRFVDKFDDIYLNNEYINRIQTDMEKARETSDIVIVLLHLGGQFNEKPGGRTRYFVKLFADLGADFIINTHPHIVQGTERIGSAFVAYCLGNYCISPSSIYIPRELKPEYSIALHLCIENTSQYKLSFSILKIVENKRHEIRVVPIDNLQNELDDKQKIQLFKDAYFIYERFVGKRDCQFQIKHEYELLNFV